MSILVVGKPDMDHNVFPSATGYHVDDAGRLHVTKTGEGNLATFHADSWRAVERKLDTK